MENINSKSLEEHTINGQLEQWKDKDGNRLNFNHSSKRICLYLAKDQFKERYVGTLINRVLYSFDRGADHFYVRANSLCFNWKAVTRIEPAGLVGIAVNFNPKDGLIALRATLSRCHFDGAHKYVPPMRKGSYFIAITDVDHFDFDKTASPTGFINYADYELQIKISYTKFAKYKSEEELKELINKAWLAHMTKSDQLGKPYTLEDSLRDTRNP